MIDGSAARTVLNTPSTLTSMTRLNAAGSTFSTDPKLAMPALAPRRRFRRIAPRRIGGGLHGGQIAHVGERGQHAVAAELGGQLVQRRLVEVGQDQIGALAVQPSGDLGADTAAPPVMKTTLPFT